jgi:hypothetical protein
MRPHFAVLVLVGAAIVPSIQAEDTAPEASPEALPTVPPDHPVRLDRTGIRWVLPYERTQATARKTKHPMLIKAVAFGTTKSGCW